MLVLLIDECVEIRWIPYLWDKARIVKITLNSCKSLTSCVKCMYLVDQGDKEYYKEEFISML